jgi:hypothetical protein
MTKNGTFRAWQEEVYGTAMADRLGPKDHLGSNLIKEYLASLGATMSRSISIIKSFRT